MINSKTSIINILVLKNIESSLNNTLVELPEKIKQSIESGDTSTENLTNQLTYANNSISQLNTEISKRAKFAKSNCNSFGGYASLNVSLNFTPNFLLFAILIRNIMYMFILVILLLLLEKFIKAKQVRYFKFHLMIVDLHIN